MPLPRSSRERLAGTLTTAFADGLLSELTLSHRLGELFGQPLVNPQRLVGDLSVRAERRPLRRELYALVGALRRRLGGRAQCQAGEAPLLLGLDWSTSSRDDLLIGRDARVCDVVLADHTVSRRHARLRYRDGSWIIQDLRSTNGISVNGVWVGRCRLRPGDQLRLGRQALEVD